MTDTAPQRMAWHFEMAADVVQKAAAAKREFHEARLKAWREAEVETEKKIREEGIAFRAKPRRKGRVQAFGAAGAKAPLDQYNTSNAGYRATDFENEVDIDDSLLADLRDAQGKVAEHLAKVREYQSWENALKLLGPKTISLNFNDVEYFDLYAVTAKVEVPV